MTTTTHPRTVTPVEPALSDARQLRVGGGLAVAGAATMIAGAVCHAAFGADLFAAIEPDTRDDIAAALTDIDDRRFVLAIGTWLWILGATTMCAAGTLLVHGVRRPLASIARWAFAASTGAVIIFFTAMLAIVEVLAPAHARGEDVITLTHTVGLAAATADWIVTAMILGVGYFGVVFSGRGGWAPEWLVKLASVTLAIAVLSVTVGLHVVPALGFAIVIVGLATVLATGITAMRDGRR